MADPIRALLRELLDFAVLCDGLLKGEGLWDDDSECDGGLLDRARATLAAEPPAPAPAADEEREEREELARWLEFEADNAQELGCATIYDHDRLRWAADYLRQLAPAPVPVPVAKQPWKRPGWCDARGRCWWGRCADDFFSPEWTMATLASIEEFCSDAMPQHCLPHWAIPIPQPPQANTTHPTPTEPPTDD